MTSSTGLTRQASTQPGASLARQMTAYTQPLARQMTTPHSMMEEIQEGYEEGDEEYTRGGYKIRKTKKRKNIKKKKNTKNRKNRKKSKKRKNTKKRKDSKRKTKR
jgi:hypothetical protein